MIQRDLHKKRLFRKILYSMFVFFVLLIISVGLSVKIYQMMSSKYAVSREIRLAKEEELEIVLAKKNKLEQNLNFLASPLGIEKELRSKFDVSREGESVVIVINSEAEEEIEEEQPKAMQRFWTSVKSLFE